MLNNNSFLLNNDLISLISFTFSDNSIESVNIEQIFNKNEVNHIDKVPKKDEFKLNEHSIGNIEIKIKSEITQNPEYNNSMHVISTNSKTKNQLKNNILKKDSVRLGRKRKDSSSLEVSKHNKYSDDNLRRKVKHLTLKNLLNFINEKIEEKYKSSAGENNIIIKLRTINHDQTANATVKFNEEFLGKTIGDIFSANISTRYSVDSLSYNKNIIEKLKDDNYDYNRKQYFIDLFNLTFKDCLQHFGGIRIIEQLEGMKTFNSLKEEFKDDKEYLNLLYDQIIRFEEILNNKRKRCGKKRNTSVEDNKNH